MLRLLCGIYYYFFFPEGWWGGQTCPKCLLLKMRGRQEQSRGEEGGLPIFWESSRLSVQARTCRSYTPGTADSLRL